MAQQPWTLGRAVLQTCQKCQPGAVLDDQEVPGRGRGTHKENHCSARGAPWPPSCPTWCPLLPPSPPTMHQPSSCSWTSLLILTSELFLRSFHPKRCFLLLAGSFPTGRSQLKWHILQGVSLDHPLGGSHHPISSKLFFLKKNDFY